MLSKRSLGRLEQRKAGFHHAADKAYYLILAVLVIALHDDMPVSYTHLTLPTILLV